MTDPITLAVFASDKGPGDAQRSSIMSEAGTLLARKGARIVCLANAGGLSVPLLKSAIAAGGDVTIIADTQFTVPTALSRVAVERFETRAEEYAQLNKLADVYVGLPGSLGSVTSLYETWVNSGSGKPVALLNRNRAYEVLRGFAADVLSHSVKQWERNLQFADNVEDLWNKIARIAQ